jgi:hypothetical protein
MYDKIKDHIGHKIECVSYAKGKNVAIECLSCYEVIDSYNRGE